MSAKTPTFRLHRSKATRVSPINHVHLAGSVPPVYDMDVILEVDFDEPL